MFSYRPNKLALEAYWFHLFKCINVKKLNLHAFFGPPGISLSLELVQNTLKKMHYGLL